jgi:hypothetical protein
LPDGTRVLINDTNNPNALLAFRARNAGAVPVLNPPTVTNGTPTISWTGIGMLEAADVVTGPWYTSPNQNNPQAVIATSGRKFYRVRHF